MHSSARRSLTGRRVALLLVFCLIAAACVDEGDETGTDTTTSETSATDNGEASSTSNPDVDQTTEPVPTEPVVLTASDRGVSETTITLGVAALDIEALVAAGIFPEETALDEVAAWENAVQTVNERGGIHGRTLELAFATFLPLGLAQAEAACVEIVEDNEVFAALGSLLVPEVVLCYSELNGTPFVGIAGSLTDEILDRSPELVIATDPKLSDTVRAMYDFAESEGALDKRVAVHGDDQARVEAAVSELESRGANVVSTTIVTAPETDVQARVAEFDGIFERWRTDDAEVVINVGTGLDVLSGMGRQEYYIDVYGAEGGAVNYQADEEREFEAARRYTVVAGPAPVAEDHPPTVACEDAWNERNPDQRVDDFPEQVFAVWASCAAIELFTAIAEAAGPDLTHESYKAAVDQVGDIDLPLVGPAQFGSDNPSAPTHVNVSRWDDELGIFSNVDTVEIR